ncbi:hypothetical protein ACJX0J_013163, partial [Zea mays]
FNMSKLHAVVLSLDSLTSCLQSAVHLSFFFFTFKFCSRWMMQLMCVLVGWFEDLNLLLDTYGGHLC